MPKTTLTPHPGPYTLEELIAELEREKGMRESLYPERVFNHEATEFMDQQMLKEWRKRNFRAGRMPREQAQRQLGLIDYLLDILRTAPRLRLYTTEAALRLMRETPGRRFTTVERDSYRNWWADETGRIWTVWLDGTDNQPEIATGGNSPYGDDYWLAIDN